MSKASSTLNEPQVDSQMQDSGASTLSNAERRALKKRFDSLTRRLEKVSERPEQLKRELPTIDPTDYQALLDKQAEIAAAEAELEELETEWLELSERLGE